MDLLTEYRLKHQHPMNRVTHSIGIPLIVFSLAYAFFDVKKAFAIFCIGWLFQFAGHAFERNLPAFFKKPIHLLVGPLWWLKRLMGRLEK